MSNIVFKAKGFEIRANSNGYTLTHNGKYLASTYSNRKKIDYKTWAAQRQKERVKAINTRIDKLYKEIDTLSETLSLWEELPEIFKEELLKEYQNGKADSNQNSGNP